MRASVVGSILVVTMVFSAGMVFADGPDGLQTPSVEFTGAFFGGGGPVYGLVLFDLEELNRAIPGVGFTGDLQFGEESAFFIHGGGGFGASDLRFGGRGAGGSWTVPVESDQFDRAELKLDYSGFFCELLLSGHPRLPIFTGLLIGGLDLELCLARTPAPDFTGAISAPFLAKLKRSYFLLEPYLSIEFRLLDFLGLKLGAGYLFGISTNEWRTPFRERIGHGPLKTLSAPIFEVMVIFGG